MTGWIIVWNIIAVISWLIVLVRWVYKRGQKSMERDNG